MGLIEGNNSSVHPPFSWPNRIVKVVNVGHILEALPPNAPVLIGMYQSKGLEIWLQSAFAGPLLGLCWAFAGPLLGLCSSFRANGCHFAVFEF